MNQQQLDDLIAALTAQQGGAGRAHPVPATTQSLIPIFSGDRKAARAWLEAIEQERVTQGWSYVQTLTVAQGRLSPDVKNVVKWWNLNDIVKQENAGFTGNENDADKQRWDGFVRHIKECYVGTEQANSFIDALVGVHQREAETAQMFAMRVQGAISEFLEMPANTPAADKIDIIRERLGMFMLSRNTLTPDVFKNLPTVPTTFKEMVDALIAAQVANQGNTGSWTSPAVAAADARDKARAKGGRSAARANRGRGAGAGKAGATANDKDVICWYCNTPGHTKAQCYKYANVQKAQGKGTTGNAKPAKRTAAAAHNGAEGEGYQVLDAQDEAYAAYVSGNGHRVQSFL